MTRLLDEGTVNSLIVALERTFADQSRHRRFGLRNLLARCPEAAEMARSAPVVNVARAILGERARPVRGILFDKLPEANWLVPWHQDRTIEVVDRVEVDGYGPWSSKDGIWHVQPPARVMEQMLAIRVHLDPCGPANGPLQVLPGTHRMGVLGADAIGRLRREVQPEKCIARAGGVVCMRPLLLHASSVCESPSHRRVIHMEYAAFELDGGLAWRTG